MDEAKNYEKMSEYNQAKLLRCSSPSVIPRIGGLLGPRRFLIRNRTRKLGHRRPWHWDVRGGNVFAAGLSSKNARGARVILAPTASGNNIRWERLNPEICSRGDSRAAQATTKKLSPIFAGSG